MILRVTKTEQGKLRIFFPDPNEKRKKVKAIIGDWDKEMEKLVKENEIIISFKADNVKTGPKKQSFIINSPGEYEISGIFVNGIIDSGKDPIYLLDTEDVRACYVHSFVRGELDSEVWEKLEEVEILFAPLFGKSMPDPKKAKSLFSQVDPRVIVFVPDKEGKSAASGFLKEIGAKSFERGGEVSFNKSDFNEEKRTFFVLDE